MVAAPNGRSRKKRCLGGAEVFGLNADEVDMTVTAKTDTEVLIIKKTDFFDVTRGNWLA